MNMKNLQTLIKEANSLYNKEASIEKWLETFQPIELAKLWHETCQITKVNPDGAFYDDEVYNALNSIGYFN